MTLNDVKLNHGSLQSELTSLTLFRCKQIITACKFFYCLNFSAYIRAVAKDLVEANINIGNEFKLHGPSMFAVKAKIYRVLYNQASSIAFDETFSYWSALKSS